ncbi:unnamed protein product [Nesidiocoris tenuis]|uniref:Uncharacterized protein n=1 Tax=Nesidiocoris tenuis TaxID=355587 RepID=A0A6H5GCH0_9HEMI|nr:unnamed protein product [Nesidiocoris tenuis]
MSSTIRALAGNLLKSVSSEGSVMVLGCRAGSRRIANSNAPDIRANSQRRWQLQAARVAFRGKGRPPRVAGSVAREEPTCDRPRRNDRPRSYDSAFFLRISFAECDVSELSQCHAASVVAPGALGRLVRLAEPPDKEAVRYESAASAEESQKRLGYNAWNGP